MTHVATPPLSGRRLQRLNIPTPATAPLSVTDRTRQTETDQPTDGPALCHRRATDASRAHPRAHTARARGSCISRRYDRGRPRKRRKSAMESPLADLRRRALHLITGKNARRRVTRCVKSGHASLGAARRSLAACGLRAGLMHFTRGLRQRHNASQIVSRRASRLTSRRHRPSRPPDVARRPPPSASFRPGN